MLQTNVTFLGWDSRLTCIFFCWFCCRSLSNTANVFFSEDKETACFVYTEPSSKTMKSGSLEVITSGVLRHCFRFTTNKDKIYSKKQNNKEFFISFHKIVIHVHTLNIFNIFTMSTVSALFATCFSPFLVIFLLHLLLIDTIVPPFNPVTFWKLEVYFCFSSKRSI